MELSFNPFFLLKSAFKQTIGGYLLGNSKEIASKRKLIALPDGDFLSLEISTPKKWKEEDSIAVLVHGLCGSHKSPIMVRTAKKLVNENMKVVRLNLRGCGSGRGLAKSSYYSGDFSDIYFTLKLIKKKYPKAPIILIGFSLGGNIILKMAGDLRWEAQKYVEKIIAFSPPVDVKSSVEHFEKKGNSLYKRHFSRFLIEDMKSLKKMVDNFPDIFISPDITLSDFNERFVVPFFGFNDVFDYYQKSSSIYVISDIKVPTKILFAKDDPLVCSEGMIENNFPKNVEVYFTENGGHLGYLGSLKDKRGFFWLDSLLLDWIIN